MTDIAVLIQRLTERRDALLKELGQIEDALDDEPSKDWEDRAAERQGDEVLEAMGHHDQDELRRINAALTRHAAGDYGVCVTCGDDSAPARLEAVPETPFCANCAARA